MLLTLAELAEIIGIAMDGEEVPELHLQSNLYEDVGMDSMGAVIMVVEIQRRIGVALDEDLIPKLRTPEDVLGAIAAAQGSYAVV